MATNAPQLADEIAAAIGQSFTTAQLIGFATGVLEEVTQNGSATFGGFPGPHPISGLSGSSMANKVVTYVGYPFVSSVLIAFCGAIADHIMTNGQVTYTSPIIPLDPANSWTSNGTISGLNGPQLASEIQAAVGYPFVSTQLIGFATAITDHIMNNAEVNFGVIT